MNINDLPKDNIETPDIGAHNVERLVGEAYLPETPDPDFVRRVEASLCASARELASARARAPHASASSDEPPSREGRLVLRRLAWVLQAAAALLILTATLHFWPRRSQGPELPSHDGADLTGRAETPQRPTDRGLTPRQRPPAPRAEMLDAGKEIRTQKGQRRRVVLPDGSVAYLNQNTVAKLEDDRRLCLSSGEVYVEVAPRPPGADGATFRVETPSRRLSALGTRFAVRADSAGTGVVVTQGKVRVEGLDAVVGSGFELPAGAGRLVPAPRASHTLQWTRELMTATESALIPGSEYAGGALVAVDPSGQEAKLSLRKYHIDVHIEDGFARTTIDQTYFNHDPWRMEGTFYFPLPPDASLSRLAMYVDGNLMEGGMAERDYARQVYETIMYTRKDPALLEWVDGSTFKMRVFPLEGRQEKRIILSYTQRLESLYGQIRYRFPAGHNLEVVRDWSFHARVKHGAKLAWASSSHPTLRASKRDNDLFLDLAEKNVKIDEDIVLELQDTAELKSSAEIARFSSAEHEKDRYVMLRYRPNLPGQPLRERRDWIFLFESSGDRDPLLARVQADIIQTLLANAEHDDTFALLTAGTRVKAFAAKAMPATPANIKAAADFLDQIHLVGALDLAEAFKATEPYVKAARNPYLVQVGSGIAAVGERREDILAKRVPEKVRYVGVGVGKRWGRGLMKAAADSTGGYVTQINPDEPVTWRAFDLAATLNTPRLLNVTVVDDAEKATFLRYAGSLAQGEELCAVARLAADQPLPKRVTVSGTLDGQPFHRTLPVADVARGADYLPRTWAKLEIDRLLAEDAAKNKDRIVALSKAMYVMTPFTSLLVLENEQMYEQFKVDRGRKDHWAMYRCPDTIPVIYEPLDGQAVNTQNAPKNLAPAQKRTPAQVLQTIMIRVPPPFLCWPNRPADNQLVLTALQAYERTAVGVIAGQPIGGMGYALGLPISMSDGSVMTDTNLAANPYNVNGTDLPFPVNYLFFHCGMPRGDRLTDSSRLNAGTFYAPVDFDGTLGAISIKGVDPQLVQQAVDAIQGRPYTVTSTPLFHRPFTRFGGTGLGFSGGFGGNINGGFSGGFGGSFNGGIGGFSGFGFAGATISDFRGTGFAGWVSLDRLKDSISVRGPGTFTKSSDEFSPMARVPGQKATFKRAKDFAQGDDGERLGWALDREEADPVGEVYRRIEQGYHANTLMYQRPAFTGDERVFQDLVSYAPGMNSSWADIQAVLEGEAKPDAATTMGTIDAGARELINNARSNGWQAVTVTVPANKKELTVHFDGQGRFAYERTLETGLREHVVCDGKTLLHLYPEIGLGARRTLSRFHRTILTDLVPWALPSVEDLARGADLRLVGKDTVVVAPRNAAVKAPGGQSATYETIHLLFADGRLAERRVVEMPGEKVIYRETNSPAGVVKWFNAEGKEIGSRDLKLRAGEAPALALDMSSLVVLPLPYRSREHLRKSLKTLPDGQPAYADLTADQAIELLAAEFVSQQPWEALRVYGRCFQNRGDRRLGFFVLLSPYCFQDYTLRHFLEILKNHGNDPLARYLVYYSDPQKRQSNTEVGDFGGPRDGFLHRLSGLRDLYLRWNSGRANQGDETTRQAERRRLLDYVRQSPVPKFSWALLDLAQRQHGTGYLQGEKDASTVYDQFDQVPGLSYTARYERARSMLDRGKWQEAVAAFRDLYGKTLKQGILPPIDSSFRQAFMSNPQEPEAWGQFLQTTADALLKESHRLAVLGLAWQCRQLGDTGLAADLFNLAIAGLSEKQRPATTLAAIEYLWHARELTQAEVLLQPLLADRSLAKQPALWRLVALIAAQQGTGSNLVPYLEKALDLEYRELPEVINLGAVRQDYGRLLAQYQILAGAMTTLHVAPPDDFVSRVIKVADRWRSLDSDGTLACQAAARVLKTLNENELAWDYLTTPIGQQPNQAAPWLTLAQTLHAEGSYGLADRAYAQAFEAEPTNAQILWDRAMNLQQTGMNVEAAKLFRQLAEGQWQPRFMWLKTQARQQLGH
jgi:tetratricopeptide (TPR) repeat protein